MSTAINQFAHVPAAATMPADYGWGTLKFLCDATLGQSPHVSMARVTLQSGKRNILHVHPNCDELVHVLRGEVRHRCGDVWVLLQPGDTLRISQGVIHQGESVSAETAEMIVVYSTGQRDTVILEEGSK